MKITTESMTFMQTDDLNILYEDAEITVCEKPKGILSENALNGEKGIIGLLSDRAGKPLHLLHRLDRNVGGVMVFANTKKSAAVLSTDIAQGRFLKNIWQLPTVYPKRTAEFIKIYCLKIQERTVLMWLTECARACVRLRLNIRF